MTTKKTKAKSKTPVKKTKRKSRKKKTSFSKLFLKWIFIGGVWALVAVFFVFLYYSYDLPDVSKLSDSTPPTITILDRNGEQLATIGSLYGKQVTYQMLPKHMVDAIISTEDRRFFDHFGIDIWGMMRAAYVNYKAGRIVQGGSTITQQLAKVTFLTHDRTLKRKIQEMILAIYLERHFTKEQILSSYLNRIYFGSGNYGIDAAAKSYFNKEVTDLNLYESAMLSGLVRAPSRYSPFNNIDLAHARADQVLINMVDNDKLSTNDVLQSANIKTFAISENKKNKSPYFVDWVKDNLGEYINSYSGNLTITTTLDSKLQQDAEASLARMMSQLSEEHNANQGAIVTMTPKGQILSMVGGLSYQQSQFNRASTALRQPGSAFKLFVYLAALEQGYKPDDIFTDQPIDIKGWKPQNWNNKYVGEVSLRNAFSNSINSVSVALAQKVGIANIIKTARKLGITSDISNDLSVALGTSEVSLLELTGAYAHLANFGNNVWVHGITKVKDEYGIVLYERSDAIKQRVISTKATADMNDMLINVIKSGTGKRAQIGSAAAGKTGTSQDSRDAWFVGFTPYFVTGIWIGNDDNAPMNHVGGGGAPATVWQDFTLNAQKDIKIKTIPTTQYSVKRENNDGSIWQSIISAFSGKKVSVEYDYPSN